MIKRFLNFISIPKIAIYLGLVVVVVYFLHQSGIATEVRDSVTAYGVHQLVASGGAYSYLLYVVFVFLMTLTPLASSAMWLIAGYLFTPWIAIVLTVVAEVAGAAANYVVGRNLIGGLIDRGYFPKVRALVDTYHGKLSMPMVFGLGLVPVSTTNITGYAAGLTHMILWRYLTAWGLGVLVMSSLTIHLGRSAAAHAPWRSVVLVTAVLVVVIVALRLVRRQRDRVTE